MWQLSVYSDTTGKSRWRLKASNGQTVASSGESFASHSNAVRAAQAFKSSARTANFEVYKDSGGNYRWRVKATNGQTTASSGESFSSHASATRAAENVRDNAGGASGP